MGCQRITSLVCSHVSEKHLRGGILRTCNDRTVASKTHVRRPTIGWWLQLSELKITNITYVPSVNTLETLWIKNGLKCSLKKSSIFQSGHCKLLI